MADDSSIEQVLEALRAHPGLRRKAEVGRWARGFARRATARGEICGPGDDAGAVPWDAEYVLLSCEGIWAPMLADPWFAGFASVTVNVNDIYAMGGRPLGIVAAVFAGEFTGIARESFLDGMTAGLEHYGVPMLGGHTSPEGGCAGVAVCVAGRASKLMRGDGARAGDVLVAALDLKGARRDPFYAWDTVTTAPGERTLERLEAMPELAELGALSACKDVSSPGLLGTFAMMLESSGAGAAIRLDDLPIPAGVDMKWWLAAYPSFGFALAAPPGSLDAAAGVLRARGIEHAVVGEATRGSSIQVSWRGRTAEFLDWSRTPVTGLFR